MNKCVFLDRDGTINIDKGYLYLPEDFEFLLNVPVALKMIKNKGFMLIVISNQSGIARGKYTICDVEKLHNEINRQLLLLCDITIDAFYICPHHILGTVPQYSKKCNCRKPKPELIYKAAADYSIDLKASYMIGDKESDILAGNNAGVKSSFRVNEKNDLLYYANLLQ